MQYTTLGKTGLKVSRLGFGAMRLPMKEDKVDRELAIPILHRAFEGGLNYVDSAASRCVCGVRRLRRGVPAENPHPPAAQRSPRLFEWLMEGGVLSGVRFLDKGYETETIRISIRALHREQRLRGSRKAEDLPNPTR